MAKIAVVVPSQRVVKALRPLIVEAARRGIPVVSQAYEGDVVVGLDGFVPPARVRIAVDNFFDGFRSAPNGTQIMCWMGDWHYKTHCRLWDAAHARGALVGWLHARELPQAPRTSAVFFTPKMRVDRERRQPWFLAYYLRALMVAKRTAAYNGLDFIIKSRAKHGDPWWVRAFGKPLLDDADSLTLLSKAAWCVHFGSAAALEAAYAGCYAYWYPAPEAHIQDSPGWDYRRDWMTWPGVSRRAAPGKVLPVIDLDARASYVSTFLGNCDGKAAARVLDLAESAA